MRRRLRGRAGHNDTESVLTREGKNVAINNITDFAFVSMLSGAVLDGLFRSLGGRFSEMYAVYRGHRLTV